jgi:hypothetical protein
MHLHDAISLGIRPRNFFEFGPFKAWQLQLKPDDHDAIILMVVICFVDNHIFDHVSFNAFVSQVLKYLLRIKFEMFLLDVMEFKSIQ